MSQIDPTPPLDNMLTVFQSNLRVEPHLVKIGDNGGKKAQKKPLAIHDNDDDASPQSPICIFLWKNASKGNIIIVNGAEENVSSIMSWTRIDKTLFLS